MTDYYKVGEREKSKKPRRIRRFIIFIIILILLFVAFVIIRNMLKPKVTIKQSAAVTTKFTDGTKTRRYDEPDFTIYIPDSWTTIPRPAGPYNSFAWGTSDSGSKGQIITVYEDTIPGNFDVNRVLAVSGQVDHLSLDGTASDNCITFTQNLGKPVGEFGIMAKWHNIQFICDRSNQERDVLGTSSVDGVNTVNLTTSQGVTHKFFFSYDNHSLSPDYGTFYAALESLAMK